MRGPPVCSRLLNRHALIECVSDDRVMAAELADIACHMGGAETDDEIRDLSLDVLAIALVDSLMIVGDLTESGFAPWGVGSNEALESVRSSWEKLGRSPYLGEVCWLENPAAGDGLADRLSDDQSH